MTPFQHVQKMGEGNLAQTLLFERLFDTIHGWGSLLFDTPTQIEVYGREETSLRSAEDAGASPVEAGFSGELISWVMGHFAGAQLPTLPLATRIHVITRHPCLIMAHVFTYARMAIVG